MTINKKSEKKKGKKNFLKKRRNELKLKQNKLTKKFVKQNSMYH